MDRCHDPYTVSGGGGTTSMSGSGERCGVGGSDGRGVCRSRRQRTIDGKGVLGDTGVQLLHMLFGEMRRCVSSGKWLERRISRMM